MADLISYKDRYRDHETFRSYLVESLKRQLFGPDVSSPEEESNELLSVPPLQLYATGVLFPQKALQDVLEDSPLEEDVPSSEEDLDTDLEDTSVEEGRRTRSAGSDEAGTTYEMEPLNLANEFSPAALGLSFRIKEPATVIVRVSYGTYRPEQYDEPHPRAGKIATDGQPFPPVRPALGYRRTHHEPAPLKITISGSTGNMEPVAIGGPDSGLKLHTTVRRRGDASLIVSAMLVNENKVSGAKFIPENADCFFQVGLAVSHPDGSPVFMPIDRDAGSATDEELESLELLYRHRRAFSLGHGVAGDWNRDEKLSELGYVDQVMTAAVPVYELKPIKPRTDSYSDRFLNLSMRFLYEGQGEDAPKNQIMSALTALVEDYASWIESIKGQTESLPESMQPAAARHLMNCRRCCERIQEGLSILAQDDRAFLAFRLMNKAMLVQQYHSSVLKQREYGTPFPDIPAGYRDLPGGDRQWRPFQLAFVLMNIAGMTSDTHQERTLVDLIWFPTGGGKTEAYLGLAAFAILYERLHGRATGTTVLMRYTLRLLTAQQFQRASALILALEAIRKDRDLNADLGQHEISIGLWVGQSLSPNKRDEARSALRKLKRQDYAQNPFQVLYCPWCGVDFTNKARLGYSEVRTGGNNRTVKLVCPDASCRYSANEIGLPVYVIDEDIYEEPPTLLIGTVDKFAQIAWNENTGRLFGIGVDHPPPCLVIQDELHLISGPLGTIVGLYETAIDRLCSREGHTHKIVASTATIRRANQQCRDLYDRETFEFPPQGIRAGDSYFAYEDTASPGRLYAGVMATAVKSHQTALVRTCSPLLQGVCYKPADVDVEDDQGDRPMEIVDPYGTLVWYFNSLRELGHAATLCTGDIPEFLKGLCHRLNIPPEQRRYVREVVELTSRRTADEIPEILSKLEIPWRMKPVGKHPIDVLLATNMIAVGVDVSRLGLIVMSGQPKSASEYIQATSRVGRQHPGLVVTVYTQNKSRDRSHYERFVAYHQSIYRYVEPTSVTPFSPQARERGLRGLLIALARLKAGVHKPDAIVDREPEVMEEVDYILTRIDELDSGERDDAESELIEWLDFWKRYQPPEYGRMGGSVATPTLAYPFGSSRDPQFQRDSWPLMTSMRNVDGTCAAQVLNVFNADQPSSDEVE